MSELPGYDDALQRVLAAVRPIEEAQRVSLAKSVGRVLALDIIADRDLPPFDRSQLDGYAVVAESIKTGVSLPVSGTIAAGTMASEPMPPATCMAIATGAPLPSGSDAVVGHEDTDCGDPVRFACIGVSPGAAVHPRGADARDGACLIEAGTMLAPQHLGIAASCGVCEMDVRRRPRCVVLTTGDEVVPVTKTPSDCQIRNGNAPMLMAALDAMGAEVCAAVHLPDTVDDTNAAVGEAIERCDLVVTVGGISEGARDHVLGAMHAAGGEVVLRKAAIQPGKPITV
ncbi:MAG: molybdopterin molybdotransferase MoeA, partial [Phycisphaerales bacterium]|nr:molybdopterin molybdotransferase MoeA [Phycisphaerales bacterium]